MTPPAATRDPGSPGRLDGCTVVITREHTGELGRLLEGDGATVVHVPLIEVVDADPRELTVGWESEPDWLIVTSPAGAERTAAAAAARPDLRLAAVGTATAAVLEAATGRRVDLIPTHQLATALVERFVADHPTPQRILVAQADRAGPTLVDGLVAAGHHVVVATAYHTLTRVPSDHDLERARHADAIVFASGSSALAWSEAFGDDADDRLPPIVVAIGPSTARVAGEVGLKVSNIATDHSVSGIIDELRSVWVAPGRE